MSCKPKLFSIYHWTIFHLPFSFIPFPVGYLFFKSFHLHLKEFMTSFLALSCLFLIPFRQDISPNSVCFNSMKFLACNSSHLTLTLTFSFYFLPLLYGVCYPVVKMYSHLVCSTGLFTNLLRFQMDIFMCAFSLCFSYLGDRVFTWKTVWCLQKLGTG